MTPITAARPLAAWTAQRPVGYAREEVVPVRMRATRISVAALVPTLALTITIVVCAGRNAPLRTSAVATEHPARVGAIRTAAVVPVVLRPMDAAAPTCAAVVRRQTNATPVTNARARQRIPMSAPVSPVVRCPTGARRFTAAPIAVPVRRARTAAITNAVALSACLVAADVSLGPSNRGRHPRGIANNPRDHTVPMELPTSAQPSQTPMVVVTHSLPPFRSTRRTHSLRRLQSRSPARWILPATRDGHGCISLEATPLPILAISCWWTPGTRRPSPRGITMSRFSGTFRSMVGSRSL